MQHKTLDRLLFFLLILFLPSQLGRHFWIADSLVLGRRIDYLSPTLYFTDIILLALLVVSFKFQIPNFKSKIKIAGGLFFATALMNILFSTSPLLSFIKWSRLIFFALFGLYVYHRKPKLSEIAFPLSLACLFSSLLALAQFLLQRSVGGLFWFLGERTFTSSTPGIAQASVNGELLLRPYATFSHPNVLAGFLLVSIPLISVLLKNKSRVARTLGVLSITFSIIAIILSMSRSVWIVSILLAGWFTFRLFKKQSGALYSFFPFFNFVFVENSKSVFERFFYIEAALKMFASAPLFGVGLNAFLPLLPSFINLQTVEYAIQPVHSVYLLVLAETGIIGFFAFMLVLVKALKNLIKTHQHILLYSFFAILLLSLNDHYFFTLQQTQLLAVLILGLSFKREKT